MLYRALAFLLLAAYVAADTRAVCQELYSRIAAAQVQEDTHFILPNHWQKQKGLWPSYVHFNTAGGPGLSNFRNNFSIYDNNGFTSIWISEMLIEADNMGIVNVEPKVISDAVEAIVTYSDRNFPGHSRISFWPQTEVNGTFIAWPINLRIVGHGGDAAIEVLASILKEIGLKDWAAVAKSLAGTIEGFLHAFNIPADFDDSYCNQALGSLLKQSTKFSDAYKTWSKVNTMESGEKLSEATLKYAWSPYSSDIDTNSIDPRTYYFMHDYFGTKTGSTPFTIPTTWIENIKENCELIDRGYRMPFTINNVDASVLANVLLGLTQRYVSDPKGPWLSPEILSLYRDSGNYLAWVIADGPIQERPDIGLLYYPNVYAFFWFCSRTVEYLDQMINIGQQLPDELEHVRKHLGASLHGEVTAFLLGEQKEKKYWQQWLGNSDLDEQGRPLKRGEDRLFSTAIALNTLYDIWAITEKGRMTWLPNAPQAVRIATVAGAKYLEENINAKGVSLQNVFFSASYKGDSTSPFGFPGTLSMYTNGTTVAPDTASIVDDYYIWGMSGVVSDDEYQELVSQVHFGVMPTQVSFPGFNAGPFPYWSSEPVTQAAALLALSRHASFDD